MIAVPSFLTTNIFGGSATKIAPDLTTYSSGYLPGQEYPAENHNFLLNLLTNNVSVDITSITSISTELVNYLASQGISPNPVNNTQLLTAITTQIGDSDGTTSATFQIGGASGNIIKSQTGYFSLRNSTDTAYMSLITNEIQATLSIQTLNLVAQGISTDSIDSLFFNGLVLTGTAGKSLTLNDSFTANNASLTLGNTKSLTLNGGLVVGANSLWIENSTITVSSYNLTLNMTGTTSLILPTAGTLARENDSHATVLFTGSGNWTCPAGVYTVKLTMGGAGGGGAGGHLVSTSDGGSGGGSGGLVSILISVIPGTVYAYVVGVGGIAGTAGGASGGGNGSSSTMFSISAGGGSGGGASYASPGAGGVVTSGQGFSGNIGKVGTSLPLFGTAGSGGNGGAGLTFGSSGPASANGVGAVTNVAGTAGTAGTYGSPGGGGGGGYGTPTTGGAGGAGSIMIEY